MRNKRTFALGVNKSSLKAFFGKGEILKRLMTDISAVQNILPISSLGVWQGWISLLSLKLEMAMELALSTERQAQETWVNSNGRRMSRFSDCPLPCYLVGASDTANGGCSAGPSVRMTNIRAPAWPSLNIEHGVGLNISCFKPLRFVVICLTRKQHNKITTK